jgi:hypothetical protein
MGDRYRQAAGVGTASAFVGELDTWGPFADVAANGEADADVRDPSPIVEWSRTGTSAWPAMSP